MTEKMSETRIGDIAEVRCGLVLSRKQAREATDAKYRLLNLRAINADGTVNRTALDGYYATERLSAEYLTQVGDIIVRLTAPYTAVLVDETTSGMVVSSNFVIIRVHSRIVLPAYLFWIINTRKVKHAIFENTSSNMLGAIKPRFFASLEIAFPSVERQRTIADMNLLALKEAALLRRLAEEKRRYCEWICGEAAWRSGILPLQKDSTKRLEAASPCAPHKAASSRFPT